MRNRGCDLAFGCRPWTGMILLLLEMLTVMTITSITTNTMVQALEYHLDGYRLGDEWIDCQEETSAMWVRSSSLRDEMYSLLHGTEHTLPDNSQTNATFYMSGSSEFPAKCQQAGGLYVSTVSGDSFVFKECEQLIDDSTTNHIKQVSVRSFFTCLAVSCRDIPMERLLLEIILEQGYQCPVDDVDDYNLLPAIDSSDDDHDDEEDNNNNNKNNVEIFSTGECGTDNDSMRKRQKNALHTAKQELYSEITFPGQEALDETLASPEKYASEFEEGDEDGIFLEPLLYFSDDAVEIFSHVCETVMSGMVQIQRQEFECTFNDDDDDQLQVTIVNMIDCVAPSCRIHPVPTDEDDIEDRAYYLEEFLMASDVEIVGAECQISKPSAASLLSPTLEKTDGKISDDDGNDDTDDDDVDGWFEQCQIDVEDLFDEFHGIFDKETALRLTSHPVDDTGNYWAQSEDQALIYREACQELDHFGDSDVTLLGYPQVTFSCVGGKSHDDDDGNNNVKDDKEKEEKTIVLENYYACRPTSCREYPFSEVELVKSWTDEGYTCTLISTKGDDGDVTTTTSEAESSTTTSTTTTTTTTSATSSSSSSSHSSWKNAFKGKWEWNPSSTGWVVACVIFSLMALCCFQRLVRRRTSRRHDRPHIRYQLAEIRVEDLIFEATASSATRITTRGGFALSSQKIE